MYTHTITCASLQYIYISTDYIRTKIYEKEINENECWTKSVRLFQRSTISITRRTRRHRRAAGCWSRAPGAHWWAQRSRSFRSSRTPRASSRSPPRAWQAAQSSSARADGACGSRTLAAVGRPRRSLLTRRSERRALQSSTIRESTCFHSRRNDFVLRLLIIS